jgi:hypothetical protein
MSVNGGPAASRQFVAHPPFWGSKWASITTAAYKNPAKFVVFFLISVAAIIAFCLVMWVGERAFVGSREGYSAEMADKVFRYGGVALILLGCGAYYKWSRRRKILISVTSDGMTVNTRPGDVFSFGDAKLGVWGVSGGMTMGTALHLHSGRHRFILGGRDHRIAAGTRLDGPDAGYGLPVDIDAWLWASDFDEVLAMAGRRTGLDVRPPAPGEPTRCLLFPNPLLVQPMGPFAFRRRQQLLRSASQPCLAIDVDGDAIRVIDPNSNAQYGSAWLAQVTATPVTYRPSYRHWFPSVETLVSDAAVHYLSTTVGMVMSGPGLQTLTIGCRDSVGGLERRFSWGGNVPVQNERAAYVVSGADWLTLVEKFGLAPHLEQQGQQSR